MKYVYLLILCTLIALIISFRKFKLEAYSSLSKKEAPLKFIYGFSMLLLEFFNMFSKQKNPNPNKLFEKLKAISLGVSAFTIVIFFGVIFTFDKSSSANMKPLQKNSSLSSADVTNTTSPTDTENTSPDSETKKYKHISNTIAVIEKYREDIEAEFLGENESLFSITKPLNLISEYGEEKILISWSFEAENVIDEDGNILYENIGNEGLSTLAYAALTLNGTTATLTIPICISPP